MTVSVIAVVAMIVAVVSVVATVIFVSAARGVAVELMIMAVAAEVVIAIAAMRKVSVVSIAGVITVVYVTMPPMAAVEPGTCSDENAVRKPLRAVVAIGSAIIGSVVVIAVRAYRRRSDIDANGYLSSRRGSGKEGKRATTAKIAQYFVNRICSPRIIRTARDRKSCAKEDF
jgi:hypothetical protein